MTDTLIIRPASWEQDGESIMSIRHEVFVIGQNVPASLESDQFDAVSWYVLAEDTKQPVACARLQPNGKVTRIAVREPWRRQGVARKLLQQLLEIAENNKLHQLYLHAQIDAVNLYLEFGFTPTGPQFEEAGIQHVKMVKTA